MRYPLGQNSSKWHQFKIEFLQPFTELILVLAVTALQAFILYLLFNIIKICLV